MPAAAAAPMLALAFQAAGKQQLRSMAHSGSVSSLLRPVQRSATLAQQCHTLLRFLSTTTGSSSSQQPLHPPPPPCAHALDPDEFAYHLPTSRIATEPASPRDAAKLLVALPPHTENARRAYMPSYAAQAANSEPNNANSANSSSAKQHLRNATFDQLPRFLPPDAHVVLNDTRVIDARVLCTTSAQKTPFEVLLLHPLAPNANPTEAANATANGQTWRCMVRQPVDKLKHLDVAMNSSTSNMLSFTAAPGSSASIEPWIEEGEADGSIVSLKVHAPEHLSLTEALHEHGGEVPIPPYLRRDATQDDSEAYQTVFATNAGSVAAPTASLHFTQRVLDALLLKGCQMSRLTLHVGAGTFQPLHRDGVAAHDMHEEAVSANATALRRLADSIDRMRPIVPVGTTAARSLETLYWLGVKAVRDGPHVLACTPQPWTLSQWEAYHMESPSTNDDVCAAKALRALASAADNHGGVVRASTALCIIPGYRFRLVDALVTNFHMPDSTLMLLVGALVNGKERVEEIYRHALDSSYRFLSYGDASLLFNERSRHLWERENHRTHLDDVPMDRRQEMKVLLHSCCAPCSGAMIEEMASTGVQVTIFFYNPNIHPRKEYEIRKAENVRYAKRLGIDFVDADYDVDEWYRRAEGSEHSPERGDRCTMCFDMRFERTVEYASKHGFTHVTSTNATSRWKDIAQVNASGLRAAMSGSSTSNVVRLLEHDWQSEAMSARKYKINAEERFYKQEYCGCAYSLRDVNAYRQRQGQAPVRIGTADVYSDPVADSMEESPQAVAAFFEDDRGEVMEEWRRERMMSKLYKSRRKGTNAVDDENW